MAHKYTVDKNWALLFNDLGISGQDILRHAQLPLDLLNRKSASLTSDEYFRLWDGMAHLLKDDPTYPLTMVQALSVESFSPPIFACFCSPNLNVALNRLAHYKPIIGPMKFEIEETVNYTALKISGLPENVPPPADFMAMELAFLTQMPRTATREHIVPLEVHTNVDLRAPEAYEGFFGVSTTKSDFNGLVFSAEDATRPFLSANEEMWKIFEPTLNKRMQNLSANSRFTERVRACLMEIIASGQYSINDVAFRLAVSPRTLQRKLKAEGTSFQKELDSLRQELAENYLKRSEYSSGQIAFLLGYEDPNSFFRAFRSWTGRTPESVRAYM